MASINTNVDPITNKTGKYKQDRSINTIKNAFTCQYFSFETVDRGEILKEAKNLKSSKTIQEGYITINKVKILPTFLLIFYFLPLTNISKKEAFHST